jgi:putative DNA primase/helicase
LVAKVDPEPFPVDVLPACIQEAVREVHAFVQAPISMVAMSALGTASLAVQALVDVQRAEGLKGPVGLFLMCIAPSGERKTTCDGFFSEPIRAHEREEAEKGEPLVADYKANFSAWEAEKRGLLSKIEKARRDGKATEAEKAALRDLNQEEPKAPRVPRLMYADATPEALAWGLAKLWPSGGVMSSEAGSVFGAHGMGKDSIMRNLALLNQLWDGVQVRFDRRTSEGFLVRGARLTIGLQVQEETLREFLRADEGLARGMGFLARMLLAWPESTQGSRPYKEPPATWPALIKFKNRIAEVLAEPVPIDEEGALTPAALTLSPEAKAEWVRFHDSIEAELTARGKFCDVRDVASKTADNAARLAAIFQVFEHGRAGTVGLGALRSAALVAAWHLHEARRFLGEFAMPKELADAARLDAWLIDYCRREGTSAVSVSAIQKAGPGRLRSKATLEAAMRELEDLGRARLMKLGRCKTCEVNPALVAVAVSAVSAVPTLTVTTARTATTAAARPGAKNGYDGAGTDRTRGELTHGSP